MDIVEKTGEISFHTHSRWAVLQRALSLTLSLDRGPESGEQLCSIIYRLEENVNSSIFLFFFTSSGNTVVQKMEKKKYPSTTQQRIKCPIECCALHSSATWCFPACASETFDKNIFVVIRGAFTMVLVRMAKQQWLIGIKSNRASFVRQRPTQELFFLSASDTIEARGEIFHLFIACLGFRWRGQFARTVTSRRSRSNSPAMTLRMGWERSRDWSIAQLPAAHTLMVFTLSCSYTNCVYAYTVDSMVEKTDEFNEWHSIHIGMRGNSRTDGRCSADTFSLLLFFFRVRWNFLRVWTLSTELSLSSENLHKSYPNGFPFSWLCREIDSLEPERTSKQRDCSAEFRIWSANTLFSSFSFAQLRFRNAARRTARANTLDSGYESAWENCFKTF